MNSYQRMSERLRGKQVDRPPTYFPKPRSMKTSMIMAATALLMAGVAPEEVGIQADKTVIEEEKVSAYDE